MEKALPTVDDLEKTKSDKLLGVMLDDYLWWTEQLDKRWKTSSQKEFLFFVNSVPTINIKGF